VPETKLHKQKFLRTLSYKQRHKYSLNYFPDAENNVCSAFFGHQFSGQRRICTLLAEEVSDYEQVPRRLAVEDTNEYPVTQRKSLGKVPGHWAETLPWRSANVAGPNSRAVQGRDACEERAEPRDWVTVFVIGKDMQVARVA